MPADPILLMCAAFVVFAMLRFSIALMMLSCGLVYLWASRQDIGLIVDQTLNSMFQLSVLLAIPMFVLAGNAMNAATISERIWGAADAVIGRLRAGLGHVTVLMNVVISSMSGSAVSDAAGAGMVAIQMMRKVGNYPAGLAVAITAASSCLGPIIPPSIPMVIYAILSGASVGALFLAGVVPGLLLAVSLMLMVAWVGKRRGLPFGNAVPLAELPRAFGRAAHSVDASGGAARRHLGRRLHADGGRRGRGILGDRHRRRASTATSGRRRFTRCSRSRRASRPS